MVDKPDIAHLEWAIDHRAKIQHTLLALYEYVRRAAPFHTNPIINDLLLDHLIAAAFSLWRAIFLIERARSEETVHHAQEKFLATVVSANAITFSDDRTNSAWSFTYYLENAKHRIVAAQQLVLHHPSDASKAVDLQQIIRLVRLRGGEVSHMRYEWECAHTALRMLFTVLEPDTSLKVEQPNPPTA
jgi:hypothetical protein